MKTPILPEKLKLNACSYYILEERILIALNKKMLSLLDVQRLISRAQYKYFILRIQGYNFNQIAIKLNVTDGAVTQACKRAAIFITQHLDKLNKRVA